MEIVESDIVQSDAGRDKGKLFVVLATEGEYLLLADGKCRKVEAPKRKKRRHVHFIAANAINGKKKITNSELRKILAIYRSTVYSFLDEAQESNDVQIK